MEEYREALKIATFGAQQKLKQQMLEIVRERVFYRNILTHHAGKSIVILFLIILTHYVVCAGGHKQATKISKLIQTCTSRVKRLLAQYSDLQRQLNYDHSDVDIKDVCNLQSQFWISEHSYITTEPHQKLPASSQRRLVDLKNLKERASEEKQIVIADLIRIVESYSDHIKLCIDTISNLLEGYNVSILPPPINLVIMIAYIGTSSIDAHKTDWFNCSSPDYLP